MQRGQCHPAFCSSQFSYPLPFRGQVCKTQSSNQARRVAIVLALFSLATAFSFHSNFADQNQMIHLLKNVMMAGSLLQIVAFGAGVDQH